LALKAASQAYLHQPPIQAHQSCSTIGKSRNKIKNDKEKTIIKEDLEEAESGSMLKINIQNGFAAASPLSP